MSTGLRAGTNNDGYLQVNGTDVLTALSSGKIGIGTTPDWASATSTGIELNPAAATNWIGIKNSSASTVTNTAFQINHGLNVTTSILNSGAATFAGSLTIDAVAGTNTNSALPVLFQTAAGVIEGGSGLTYNPGGDTLSVNGNTIGVNTFRGAGNIAILSCANFSSTCNIAVGSIITTKGNVEPSTDATDDLGSATKRWANIYSADLQLSNEGSANDVDGTWGQYTIQEGEDDLFLINRRNGKKYKFNLTEVA